MARNSTGNTAAQFFDEMSRIVAAGIPRRAALKLAMQGMMAVVLARFGVSTAWAQAPCLCMGQSYDAATACCTPSGVQPKHPIASLAACPSKVPHPGYVAVPNGCGPDGGAITPFIPNGFGAASFLVCCNNHDVCYGTCNDVKASCDSNFLTCLTASCDAAYSAPGMLTTIKRTSCHGAANTYYSAVSNGGQSAFDAAQSDSCDCCGDTTCPESCAGSVCGSLPGCAPGGDCVCFTDTEGTGACVHGATPCSAVTACGTTADCPSGTACLTTSCCGGSGVCGPLCSPIGPAPGNAAAKPLPPPRRSSAAVGRTLGGF